MSVKTFTPALHSFASVLVLGLLTVTSAHAEDTAEDTDPSAIVVTGTTEAVGLSLSSRETPQSVTVVDSLRMQEQGLNDISEVMEQIVGIQSNRSSALGTDGTNYTARGFNVKNYLVDGVARPTNIYGFTEDTADMVAYERIEVIRGSAGMMTGTGQPSAAINMIRKRPGTETRASAAATVGSWDLYRLEGDLGGALTSDGHVRARVAGAWQENDTFIDREHVKRHALYGVVETDLAPGTLLTAGVEYQNFRNEAASRGGVPLFFTDGTKTDFGRATNGGANWSEFRRKSVNLFASLAHDFDKNWRLQLDAEHKSGSYDETIGYFFGSAIDKDTGLGGTLYSTRWASDLTLNAVYANLRGSFEALGQEQHVAFVLSHAQFDDDQTPYPGWWNGPAYMNSSINAFEFFENGDYPKPDLTATGGLSGNRIRTSAASGVARLKPIGPLSMIAGGRLTWWRQDSYSQVESGSKVWTPGIREKSVFTPYAGVVVDFNNAISAYASYASVFEPQTQRTVDGDMIAPLEGNTYEAGLKADFLDGKLSASAAVFYMKQDNYALADGPGIFAPDGSSAYHAVSGMKSKGFELEVNGQILPGWLIAGGFANAKATDRDGARQLPQIAKNSFKMFTSYRLPGNLDGLVLGGNLRWQGKTTADGKGPNGETYTQGSLAVVDLMASYRCSQRLSLAVHVDNIFDKKYYSGLFIGSARYGAPRAFTVSLRGAL
ncbi:TonB-dependent siderophore receptor [Novosphingobium sp. P6W]|uniref:TonB-dependent siderophore receptor n=1 Tax=Novosphingobium sp. P6W TaxID=1609758 RepID=UPI0005C2FC5D|nr:TonB-dependent siderophore receptor [Novosphingobium sp. P6W]AXB79073.1 TonB-dependent siderophore receptor [Novosphingobium sp. P6W]KIS30244.1 TonB-dependent receptor [Novosphingobium sp. P6W]